MGWLAPTCESMSAWAMFSTSAHRAEASFCSPVSGRCCCSARASEQRLSLRCYTRGQQPARDGRSCGCTRLAIGGIIHFPPKFATSCSHSRAAAPMFVTAGRTRRTRWEDFDATGHLSRSVFQGAGVPPEADVYLCGPTRFMSEMKEALRGFGVEPNRIHIELFNGSKSMTPGIVGAATRAPHLPKDAAGTGPLVSFARSAIAAHWNPSTDQSVLELAEAGRRQPSRVLLATG